MASDERSTGAIASKRRGLDRVLGVREGLAIALGSIIGVGILRTPGIVAGYLGDPWTILAIWLIGAVVAALGALLLAEMAAALPHAGGKYVYVREAFGPVAGFVAGWSELAVVKVFSAAAKTVVIAEYLIRLTGSGSVRILSVAVTLAFAAVHVGGLRVGSLLQNVSTLIKVAILTGIAATGLWSGEARGFVPEAAISPATGRLLGLAISYQLVAFTCRGSEDAAKMAEEIKDPGRSMPRILLG
ncbi:MAG: amino acid permease, partial [Gemmatimonadetes bacterium]|nr:amino acid permease [Gemmatimonadota bacterium]